MVVVQSIINPLALCERKGGIDTVINHRVSGKNGIYVKRFFSLALFLAAVFSSGLGLTLPLMSVSDALE
ncbi:hypothetical protein RO3G_09258 [Rhizopus delemar RA 99-880]|uniref:Uncharacterized protein n=1 Tax=Rhizopus delemar (strain RA 99-880 / ATCC MYA-4621 / FGSC 9543 / NRRL 43880) TaxID=246409 RepID=I1C7W8_RHIO9|nr:hypothetical protein RO3G_09258 [Rhizopus delemar RA 99-880]|eukprot:EIE84548.1 hypothetical protein RO3G_09258 [Rhizopus delemar RA 99-880]